MKIYYTDHFELPLPEGHRFPMAKYRLLRDRIVNDDFHVDDVLLVPPAATIEQLELAHDRAYIQRVTDGALAEHEIRRIGFPWSEKMVERSRRSSGATLAAGRIALSERISLNLAGGTHHAMKAAGEGYCVFNDAAVTIRTLMHEGLISKAIVVDCDVHQGNGTAEIFADDLRVVTFSIHGAKNFPSRKHPSTVDVNLEDGVDDVTYLEKLSVGLEQALQMGPFDFAVYLAGADPYKDDRLGRLQLTKDGLKRRDELVLRRLATDMQIPVAVAMAGGYAHDVRDIVDIHAATVRSAKEIWSICNRLP
jgi:acetoin utilization deacetylase AcuC-like enzyme